MVPQSQPFLKPVFVDELDDEPNHSLEMVQNVCVTPFPSIKKLVRLEYLPVYIFGLRAVVRVWFTER